MVMNCPICGKKHDVKLKTGKAMLTIEGVEVQYDENFFVCEEVDGDNEFATASMENKNLSNARSAYKEKMGIK